MSGYSGALPLAPSPAQLRALGAYLHALIQGEGQKRAAADCGIAYQTFRNSVEEAYRRLGVTNAIQAAMQLGMIRWDVGFSPRGSVGRFWSATMILWPAFHRTPGRRHELAPPPVAALPLRRRDDQLRQPPPEALPPRGLAMTIAEALLTNAAYGYPTRGHLRRHTPHILAVVHQTATNPYDGQAMKLRDARNGPGFDGNTATYYVDQDGDAVHAVDGTKYASWCSAPEKISYLDTTRPSMATVRQHFANGVNPNECVWEQIECVGTGTEPWSGAQFEQAAAIIAARAKLSGLPINRDTVVPHRDMNTVNRPSDPWPGATREARMATLIARAKALSTTAPVAGDPPMRSFGLAPIGGAHLVGTGHSCVPLDGALNDGPWPAGTNWTIFGEATLDVPIPGGVAGADRSHILLVRPTTTHDGKPWPAAKPAALLRMDTDWPAGKTAVAVAAPPPDTSP